MRAKKEKPFATEVDLCAAFIAALPKEWTAYAETAGWDILLVRRADGFQIGVQAKLQFNAHVLTQAIEGGHWYHATSAGPDCRAVLVPADDIRMSTIANFIGITVIAFRAAGEHVHGYHRRASFQPQLPDRHHDTYWYEWCPAKRHELPEYVPDVAAGAPAPNQLTYWKIQAAKICVLLETRGFVTREDFKALHIDHRRWIAKDGWLVKSEQGWVAGKHTPNLKAAHPTNYEQIKADIAKWMPPEIKVAA